MTPLSDEAERLIREARGADGPPPERLRAISRKLVPKLAAGGVVALSAAKATAVTSAAAPLATNAVFGAGSLVSSLLIGGAAGVVVVAASTLWREPAAKQTETAPSAVTTRLSSSARAPAPELERRATAEPARPPAHDEPKIPSPTPAEATSADAASALAVEVHLLNGAQHWIAAGDGLRALAIIDRYLVQHPKGALREELLAARVLALCLSGDHGAARNAARAFVAANPRSPQLPRLARSCAAGVEGLPERVDSVTDSIRGED